jgi:hypothetical protein
MKCTDAERYLDDFVDDSLPAKLAAELEAHIASCPACRAAERGLRALLAEAEALEASIEPGRDLWSGIAARIAAEDAPSRKPAPKLDLVAPAKAGGKAAPKRRILSLLAAAAALAIGIFGSLQIPSLAGSGGDARDALASRFGNGRTALAYKPRPIPAAFKASPGLAESQATFEAARAELYAALEARRDSLAPDTLKVIERNLRIIDKAAGEIEAALEKDPDNAELSSFLITTYDSEIRTLRQAALQPGGI